MRKLLLGLTGLCAFALLATASSSVLPSSYPRWEGGRSTGLGDPRWKIVNEREKLDRGWRGKIEIEFYGKVIDEKNQPVEGALIRFSIGDLSAAGTTQSERRSDAQGFVSLTGALGRGMSAIAEKTGYYNSRLNRANFEYAQFSDEYFYQPDAANPVVFHLLKKGQAEPLVYRQTLYGLKIDGTPQFLDLRSGKKTTGGDPRGDLALSLSRRTAADPNKFDWTLTLSAVGAAGLLESKEEFMFLAPETKYEQSISIQQKAGSSDYESQTRRNYYVRLADGRTFARINTDIRPSYNDGGAIDVVLFLNPSGSRNLEFDPTMTVPEAKP